MSNIFYAHTNVYPHPIYTFSSAPLGLSAGAPGPGGGGLRGPGAFHPLPRGTLRAAVAPGPGHHPLQTPSGAGAKQGQVTKENEEEVEHNEDHAEKEETDQPYVLSTGSFLYRTNNCSLAKIDANRVESVGSVSTTCTLCREASMHHAQHLKHNA